MKNWQSILIAVLGILVGAMAVMTYDRFMENHKRLQSEYSSWRKLNLILQAVESNYVDSVDYQKVSDAAIVAALQKLDPHSIYMEPRDLEESESDLAGQFEGIGIQFNVPNDTAIVLEAIPGGPSEKLGIRAGDRLMEVDGVTIAGVKCPQDSMVRKMRGPAGTKVTVTVQREKERIPFEITRAKIPTHSVDAAFMVSDTVGYLRLSKFARTTYREVASAALVLKEQGMKKLIFDIRDNSGGFLDQALLISNLFLEKGDGIVYMEGRNRKRQDYKADGNGFFKDIDLDILISEGSASSSEIFAGAMQDNGRARIIGRRSFGKGLVQEPFYFTDGSGVRLTVARYYTPSGRCLQKPYTDDYGYEVWERYGTGEMVSADSMKIEKGGIIPDVFVAIDTTKASKFYIGCQRKALPMRFASYYFDSHKDELQAIEDYDELLKYLSNSGLEKQFLAFAKSKDGLAPKKGEWPDQYIMTQVEALVSRYSKLGDNAFYHIHLSIDDTFKTAFTGR